MIESSLLAYLLSSTVLTTALGGNKVYTRVPNNIKMPWVVIKVLSGGTRSRMTQKFTGITDTVGVYIDDNLPKRGKDIAVICLQLLENYRGDFSTIDDVFITCSSIGTNDGVDGSYNYSFMSYITYKEETTFPT